MCKHHFCFRLKGPAEVYADAVGDTVTHDTSVQGRCHSRTSWRRGLRNLEPVESEDISVLLALQLQTETKPLLFVAQQHFSYQRQMPQMQRNKK